MRNRWDLKSVTEAATHFMSRSSFNQVYPGAYAYARRHAKLDLVCKHMPINNVKWTIERLQLAALEYKTRTSFKQGNEGAYKFARINNHLDTVCTHMKKVKPRWTYEKIKAEADLFTVLSVFKQTSAYKAAQGHGIVSEITAHMWKSSLFGEKQSKKSMSG
jgi:hypothetical protein